MKIIPCGTKLSTLCPIPKRYILGFMGFLAMVNTCTLRHSLAITLTEMVAEKKVQYQVEGSCDAIRNSSGLSVVNSTNKVLYDWSDSEQGIILSSFYYGYIVTHIPGAHLAESYSSKHTLGLGLLITSVCTILTPVLLHVSHGYWVTIVVLRAISGLACGPIFPSITYIMGQWIPSKERGKLGSLMFSGIPIASLLSNLLSGIVIHRTGSWTLVFYLFGTVGIIWYLLWMPLCYSYPEEHPFISEEELSYLSKELGRNRKKKRQQTPWVPILKCLPVWGLACSQIGIDFVNFTVGTDLPKYMKEILSFNVEENGIYTALPYILMWLVTLLSGNVSDWLIRRGYLTITATRRVFTSISAIGGPIFMIAASYSGCNRPLVVAMFILCLGCMGAFYSGMKVNAIDLSPNYSATVMALTNGIGAISGTIAPTIVGVLTKNHNLIEWRMFFWIVFGVSNVFNLVYVILCTSEQQWWNNAGDDEETDTGNDSKVNKS